MDETKEPTTPKLEKSPVDGKPLDLRIVGHAIDQSPITRPMLWVIVIAGLASFFDALDGRILGFALPGIAKEFGLRPQAMGIVLSATMAGMTIGSFAWGWIADKWGRRIAFMMTLLIFSLFSGLCAVAFSVGFLVGARFITGLGLGGGIPVEVAVEAEFTPARIRGYTAGLSPLMFPFGTVCASLISLFFLSKIGWRGLFLIGALPALLAVWARRGVPESPRWLVNRGRLDEARQTLHFLGITDEALEKSRVAMLNEPPTPRLPKPHFLDLFTPEMRRGTVHTWILWALTQVGSVSMILWLPSLFVRLHGTTLQQALGFMVYVSFAGLVGKLTAWFLLDRVGRKPFLIIGFGIAGVSLFAMGLTHSAAQFAIVAVTFDCFSEMGFLSAAPYTAEVYPVHIRGLGTSAAMGIGRCFGVIGPSIIGFLMQAGHPGWIWIILGSSYLTATLVTVWLGVETRGRNLEQLTKAATEGAARLRRGRDADDTVPTVSAK